jgi:2-oxoglutarate ferredoxin oxidoreductase subunit gamma
VSELEIRLSGTGGQGLILCARILSEALILEGRTIAQSQSYEPTSRGGVSRSDLVVGDGVPDYPLVTALDLLLILDQGAVGASEGLTKPSAIVMADSLRVPEPPRGDFTLHALPLCETARALGNERVANIVALGALIDLSGICQRDSLERAIQEGTPRGYQDLNLEAMREGFRLAAGDQNALSRSASLEVG